MLSLLQRDVRGYIHAKTVFPEMKISAQEFCSVWELKLEMDGEMLSPKTAVPLVVAVDFFFLNAQADNCLVPQSQQL